MRKTSIVLTMAFALLAAACGGAEQAVESGPGAQVEPVPTPQQVEEPAAERQIEPGVTPQPDWDTVEYPSATPLSAEHLPDGLEIACSDVQFEIEDALPPDQIDHSKAVTVTRSRVQWWVHVDKPKYEKAVGDDRLLSPFLVTVTESDRVETSADFSPIELPQVLRVESIPGDGSQSVLFGVDEFNSVAATLVGGPTGVLTPVARCGGYNPLFRLTQVVGGESKGSVADAYLDLLGYPPADGQSGVEDAILLSALATKATEPPINDWNALDPSTRIIDDAPDELKATLLPFVIRVAVPDSWVGDKEALLCTRTATGWNSCIALDAVSTEDYESVQAFPVEGLRAAGEDVEILLLNQDAAIRGGGSQLGVLLAKHLDDNIDFVVRIDTPATPAEALIRPNAQLSIVPDED